MIKKQTNKNNVKIIQKKKEQSTTESYRPPLHPLTLLTATASIASTVCRRLFAKPRKQKWRKNAKTHAKTTMGRGRQTNKTLNPPLPLLPSHTGTNIPSNEVLVIFPRRERKIRRLLLF